MKYNITTNNYRDFDTIEINKRAPRAYFIPYSSKSELSKTPLRDERTSSGLVRVLSGEWDFKYYPDISLLPDEIDSSVLDFDKITVPCTWQRTGYENPAYINVLYPFDLPEPELPKKMSVGVYRKTFDVTSLDKKFILAFLGVIPCIDLYLNGKFVGYSEGAHNTAEFDITELLIEGENELLAVIHKWSTATYLECQDMFRENGIFRDVLLYEMPMTFINDYHVKYSKNSSGYDISVDVALEGSPDGLEISAELYLGDKLAAKKESNADTLTTIDFGCLDVIEWNAEIPTVYELYITLKKDGKEVESLRNYTGFKTIKIDKTTFLFNGAKIKFKGVNHHDTDPVSGYVMDFDKLEKDITLMKSYNVNAVRTSHYPPDAVFITLCDLYGLYVVDEGDIETHGMCGKPHNNINGLSHNLKWAPRYVDRIMRMYYRDRNHPSITMWSLGNEAGGYACFDECYNELKKVCPEIPVHYQGSLESDERPCYDVASDMYTNLDSLEKIKNRTHERAFYKDYPMFLCEYCHAMGVGPGSLEEYWDMFYSDDIFMGGCIWEWADHSVYHKDGPYEYTYGGDHGEWRHDGNFCVDALNYPDRTPHTGAIEAKTVYRPVRASYKGDNTFVFLNTNRFRSSGYLTINWELVKDGVQVDTGKLNPDIPALAEEEIKIELPEELESNDYFINFIYTENGFEVAREQIVLNEHYVVKKPVGSGKISAAESDESLTVTFDKGSAVFSKNDGALVSCTINGKEIICPKPASKKGIFPNIFRARLDNDEQKIEEWIKSGFDRYDAELTGFGIGYSNDTVCVRTSYDLVADGKTIFECTLNYAIHSSSVIETTARLIPVGGTPSIDIPRFGIITELDGSLKNVEYYGLGEKENLPDFSVQSAIGIYRSTVDKMHEPYIMPQDNGNHGKTRYVKLTDDKGRGVVFSAKSQPLSFSVHNYTQKLLQEAKHREDLHDEGSTVLSLDGFIRGTGSGICGPDTLNKYRVFADKPLMFSFIIMPL